MKVDDAWAEDVGTGSRSRRSGANRRDNVSDEEKSLKEKVDGLAAESGKFNGRDASAILAEAEQLKATILEASLTEGGKKRMLDSLEDVNKSLAFEHNFERHCGRYIQIAILAVTILPLLVTCGETGVEFVTRPEMVVAPADLSNKHAVVTGGCGAVGLDLSIMLAQSGAGVVMACHHGAKTRKAEDVKSRLAKLGLLKSKARTSPGKGWIEVWPLQLESFAFVRNFADRVVKELGTLDLIVHNAATKEGCGRTVDGHEVVTQVNYLSPFLLTSLLLPILQKGRIVHVTCDVGLHQTDWLPWPFRRTHEDLLPRVHIDGLGQRPKGKDASMVDGDCSPLVEYANSKLALLVYSHELNRRLSGFDFRGVSHVVNPGGIDSAFGHSDSVPVGKPSMQSSVMAHLPPVWIAKQIYGYTLGKAFSALGNLMLRSANVGAKAIFHVATSDVLGDEEHGGGLFADTVGPFTDCGKPPEECGRVQPHKQPPSAIDEELAGFLWASTEEAIGISSDLSDA